MPRSAALELPSGTPEPELRQAGREALAATISPGVNRAERAASNRRAREAESERDRELILRAQRGDEPAFRKLVERHQRRAFAIAVGLVRDEQDALEIVQEAFLRVHRSLDGFNGAASFFTWLYRIVKNLSIDLIRRPSWQHELSEDLVGEQADALLLARIDGADPLDVLSRRELAERLGAAFDALPPYHRSVILMREVEGKSYEEMAREAGVSKGTIMSRLFHARKKLQRALGACYAEQTGRPDPSGGEAR